MARKATKRPEAAPREEPCADDLDHRIVEETLALAEEVGWDGVRLRLVAERLGVPLNAVASRFRDVDAIADAWLARGVAAMLAPVPAGFAERPEPARVATVIQLGRALCRGRGCKARQISGGARA